MTKLSFYGIIERYNIDRKSGVHGMNKKILLTLLSGIIALSMIGCEKKVTSTGDPDLDAAIKEVHDAVEESAKEESSNMESESLNSNDDTKIDIKKSYLVNKNDTNYMVVYFSKEIPFASTPDIKDITITGVNSGTKKELYKDNIGRFLLRPFGENHLDLPFFSNPTDNVLAFKVDWDGYEEYLLSIQQIKGMIGQPNKLLNESTYSIDETRFVKMSYDDFINEIINNLFDSLDNTKAFQHEDIKLEYLDLVFSGDEYLVNFAVTNEGNVPSDEYSLSCSILTEDGQYLGLGNNIGGYLDLEAINPGETTNVSGKSGSISKDKFDLATGSQFILQIELMHYNGGEPLATFYLKDKF